MKKILLSFIGIFALLAFVSLAGAPGALAYEGCGGIVADSHDGNVTPAHCVSPDSLIIEIDNSGRWVVAPPDPANGMGLGFAANNFEKDHGYIENGFAVSIALNASKGGAAPAFSKPRSFTDI